MIVIIIIIIISINSSSGNFSSKIVHSLQVRGIYKIERLQERNWKFESRAEFQNASKDYHSGDDSGCDDDAGSDDEEEDDNGANGGDGDSVCGDDCATLMFHGTKACNVLGVLSR